MKQPAISIIIPVYNAQKHIAKCIDSILEQDFTDFELLLLNDGSKDDSLSILNHYAAIDERVKVVDKENEGVAKTCNRGITLAQGEYIMFVDNDDYINKDYCSTFYSEVSKVDADIVVGGYQRVSDSKVLHQQHLNTTDWAKYMVIAPWAKLYRRAFLVQHNLEFLDYGIGEDVYFNLLAYSFAKKVTVIDYIGYNWYFNTESISNTDHVGFKPNIDILYLFDAILSKQKNLDSIQKYYFKRFYIYYLLYSGRSASTSRFVEEHSRVYRYIERENLQSNLSPFFNKQLKGESLKVRFIVSSFSIMEKCKLIPLFARFYCKG